MNSRMDREMHHACVQRAIELGRGTDPAALAELISLLLIPSAEVRRLAASGIGKLAGFGADAGAAVKGLIPLALRDSHPQVQQYAISALKSYGAAARGHLADLRDVAENPATKDYVRRTAASAVALIEEAVRIAEEQALHRCRRCSAQVDADEYARSMRAFDRVFCDKCFDEVYLSRRNFDTKVELAKTIRTRDGTLVQSGGERRIADYLAALQIAYRYDERIRIIQGYAIRPDFYLPEFDIYIEYWGMDTIDYQIGMLLKKKLYQQEGKRLISIYREDVPELEKLLAERLSRYMRISPDSTTAQRPPEGTGGGRGPA